MRKVFVALIVMTLALPVAAQQWSVHTIGYNYYGASSTNVADIDGNGSLDVVTTGSLVGGGVDWWNYDGNYWNRNSLTDDPGFTYAIGVDIDTDGDQDVVALGVYLGEVQLFENENLNWTESTIYTGSGCYYVTAADIEADGDVDLVICDNSAGDLVLLKQSGGTWTPMVIASTGNPVQNSIADFDNDGDLDAAFTDIAAHTVYWAENLGGANSWQTNSISSAYIYPYAVLAADHDGDGDTDLFAGWQGQTYNGGVVTYLANDGTGAFTEINSVQVPYVRDIAHGDIDNGGTADLMCTTETGAARWFCAEMSWEEHQLPGSNHGSDVTLADLDGDGDLDVITAEQDSYPNQYGAIRWWEQSGTPFPVQLTLTPQDAPVIIPATGGTIIYDAHLLSTSPNTVPGLKFWTTIMAPNNESYGPLTLIPFTLQPFMDVTVTSLGQNVPASAPAGTYMFFGHAGYYNNMMYQISDEFMFTKLNPETPDRDFTFNPEEWQATGGFDLASNGSPTVAPKLAFTSSVNPNPFNAMATVNIQLVQSEEVTLRVVNLLGQEISTLNRGLLSAGQHEFLIDASEMASGVYFLAGSVGAESITQKLVVIK